MKPYAVPLEDLDRVHVPADQQGTGRGEPPPEPPIAPEELDRQRLLGTTGAGRLRLP